ncbi:pyridoxamine 5'-phosphate oxidase family protein [Yinghuangia seranimata]|uniref:pyridoxamine 5'-phosphate oxidase family protein n=1 Tax=Yinghuangia seranimata TaxID=408067 RepID=UPI00248BA52D|nr:TIGR03618 family F420-dependent PPOX class oxidoreductase [Yinghuangia seranimata]MDI2130810.1 TIGR03618 family F420-dependent PPOX class oxidoreductase [Yinghuangia seranimata]
MTTAPTGPNDLAPAPAPAPAAAPTPPAHAAGPLAALDDEAYLAFWREYHLCTLTTLRADGTPHVVPVGVTFDPETRTARVITRGDSRKARNVRAAGPAGARVAVCQIDRRRWATLEGVAVVRDNPASVADAERRYAERYRPPTPNPERCVIEIHVDRALGRG